MTRVIGWRKRGVGIGIAGVAILSGILGADRPGTPGEAPRVAAGTAKIPDEWLEGSAATRAERFEKLKAGGPPPSLSVRDWMNSKPLGLSELKGKVVLLDFWATWCGPCLASIAHHNELFETYKDRGLVLIGVCHSRGADAMKKTAEEKGIAYPIAADEDGRTMEAFAVDSFPDYYVIDREGTLRILDCKNANVEDAIKLLLEEKGA